MLSTLPLILVASAALVVFGVGEAAQEKGDKADAQAREAVGQFFKAFQVKDLEGLMKVVDVPFCREGGKNVEKGDDLKQFFKTALDRRDFSKDKIRITLVTTLAKLEELEGKFTEAERKAVQGVLGKGHRVVKVEWDRHGEGRHRALIFVRFQEGKAKVVGII